MLRRGALALWGAAALGGCAEDVPPSAPPRRDAGAWPDLGPVENGCSAERLRELAADARREGDAWVLSADNGARAVQGALLAPCATAEHVTVWRHVMTREARVEVTVDSADPMETVAWVLDRCEPVLAEPLACSSSTPTEGGGRRANLVTVAIERAGTSVYVAVGGAQRPPREGEGPRSALGRFTLRVSEQPAIATGQPCSSAGSLAECAADASCQRGEFRGALVCLADGTRNGRCRGAGEVCDVGLRCVDSYCRGPVPEGAACDPDDLHACAAGSLCIALGATVRCIADGAFAGRCRTAGSPCDEGLLCDLDPSERFARCASLLGDGDVCDVSDVHRICARGSTCVNDADTTDALVYRCQRDGGRRGTCRVADPPCEEGLACRGVPGDSSSYCLPAVLTGAACTLQRTVDACEDFGLCTPDGVGDGLDVRIDAGSRADLDSQPSAEALDPRHPRAARGPLAQQRCVPTGLPGSLAMGMDICGDGSMLVIDLPGHTPGHQGLYLPRTQGSPVLLVGDACWSRAAYTEIRLPPRPVQRFMAEPTAYRAVIADLAQVHRTLPEVLIVPSHCAPSIAAARAELASA